MKEYVNKKEKKRTSLIIAFISILIIIPSIWIGFGVFKEIRQKRNVNAYMNEYFLKDKAKFFDSYNIIRSDSINFLIVKMYAQLDSTEIHNCQAGLLKHNLDDFLIEIIPTTQVNPNKIKELEAKLISVENIKTKFEEIKKGTVKKDIETQNLKSQLDSIYADTIPFHTLSKEAKTLFPDLEKVIIADKAQSTDFQIDQHIPVVIVKWNAKKYQSTMIRDEKKLSEWMKMRVGLDTIELVRIQ